MLLHSALQVGSGITLLLVQDPTFAGLPDLAAAAAAYDSAPSPAGGPLELPSTFAPHFITILYSNMIQALQMRICKQFLVCVLCGIADEEEKTTAGSLLSDRQGISIWSHMLSKAPDLVLKSETNIS